MAKQEITGKAFEYACLKALYDRLNQRTEISVLDDVNLQNTKNAFEKLVEQEKSDYLSAAKRGIEIILPLEPNLEFPDISEPLCLSVMPDKQGQKGDVRDVVCLRSKKGWSIGFSCKHNNEAVKHSRLSRTIDFGKDWLGFPCSQEYHNKINPIFDELDELKSKNARWSEIDKKDERFYKTLLSAFLEEMKKLYSEHPDKVPENLLHYLLGKNDFYKIITHKRQNNRSKAVQHLRNAWAFDKGEESPVKNLCVKDADKDSFNELQGKFNDHSPDLLRFRLGAFA